jgi:nucleoid DNA-binding protein
MIEIVKKIRDKLEKDNKCTVVGLGTFYRLERRKGKVFGLGEGKKQKFSKRIKFKASLGIKKDLCK